MDISEAQRPKRRRAQGPATQTPEAANFRRQFTDGARRYQWLQSEVLEPAREAAVNPIRMVFQDLAALTQQIKDFAKSLGADVVGVAEYDPQFTFTDSEILDHTRVIAFGYAMEYDVISDLGADSQEEVHRVYYQMLDISVRLAQFIGSMGYSARAHPNGGELAHIPYAYLAGLGELGKHGSLISPELGSSFRLGMVSTDLPLEVDGPQDYGIDDMCERCSLCTRFCPAEAIHEEKQLVNGINRFHVDTGACEPYFLQLWGCKICLMVCPFNGRSIFKDSYKELGKDIAKTKNAEGILNLFAGRSAEATRNQYLLAFREQQAAKEAATPTVLADD